MVHSRLAFLASFLFLLLAASSIGCQAVNGTSNGPFTGFLEGDKIDIAAEVGGRAVKVTVQQGDRVQPGQLLVTLEDDLVRARVAAADANIAAAQAQLALLEAGPRAQDLRRAEAGVAKARAGLVSATQALSDTLAIRNNPQTLLVAQAQADTRSKVAHQQLLATAAQAQSADEINRFWEQQTRMLWDGFDIYLPSGKLHFNAPERAQIMSQEGWQKAGNTAWQAWAGVQQAQANASAADANLKDISDQIANPIALDARVDQARGAQDRAQAAVQAAEATLRVLRDGASPAQLQEARAALDQARAAHATLDRDLKHYQINAPQAGTVAEVYYRTGEVVVPGAPLVRLSVAGDLTLRVYVPMSTLDLVHVDGSIPVKVDGLEGREVQGIVQRTGDQAEFTGRQAQTDSERNAQLVVVEIAIKNPDPALKAGMPASVTFK
jgi:multidrug resistance efflux pump